MTAPLRRGHTDEKSMRAPALAKPKADESKEVGPGVVWLQLVHLGGETRQVEVLDATADGVLHVRAWGTGSGVYAVHVFRTCAEYRGGDNEDTAVAHSTGWLFKSPRARRPLQWRVVDPATAVALWRRMTGRQERATKEEVMAKGFGRKS